MDDLTKGTVLYVGNFELPDKGASANRVMTNRLLFREIGYRTAYLGVTKEASFKGIRRSSFDKDTYERAYPSSTKMWLERSSSIRDILDVVSCYEDIRFIIFYNSPYSLVRIAFQYYRKSNIKVLYDCTEWNADTEGNALKRLCKKIDAFQIQYCLEKSVDGLILISSLMQKQYTRKLAILLPPLVDVEAPVWQQKRMREDDVFEFCYAGDPGKKDNMCILIDAFALLDDNKTRLSIIGITEEAYLREHGDRSVQLQAMKDRIVFQGRISHDDVILQIMNTDCFIFSRESNLRNNAGFPTKFVEAYTSGVQVIASNVSDVKRYSGDGICILQNISESEIKNAMRHALTGVRLNGLRGSFDYRSYIKEANHFFGQLE